MKTLKHGDMVRAALKRIADIEDEIERYPDRKALQRERDRRVGHCRDLFWTQLRANGFGHLIPTKKE